MTKAAELAALREQCPEGEAYVNHQEYITCAMTTKGSLFADFDNPDHARLFVFTLNNAAAIARECEELRRENELLRQLLVEHTDWLPHAPIMKARPTHGNCCTCQECGYDHDFCKCEHNAIAAALGTQRRLGETP